MSKVLLFVMLTVAAAGGAVIDYVVVTSHVTTCVPAAAQTRKFQDAPDLPLDGWKAY
jgi:hypothetical protein